MSGTWKPKYSPVHTVEYYVRIADQLIEAGAPEICLKDMAGIGRPGMLGELVRTIKEKHAYAFEYPLL